MWENFVPDTFHEIVRNSIQSNDHSDVEQFLDHEWRIQSRLGEVRLAGPLYSVVIRPHSFAVKGRRIRDYGSYYVFLITVEDDDVSIHYRDDVEQVDDGCFCVLPLKDKTYFRRSEVIPHRTILDLFGHLPDDLTPQHIEKLREHFGDEDPFGGELVKPHWRLRDWIGAEYNEMEGLFSTRGRYKIGKWKIEVLQKGIWVGDSDPISSKEYRGMDNNHRFYVFGGDTERTETYRDGVVTLEVDALDDQMNSTIPDTCHPVTITVNESGIIVDATYLTSEGYITMDEIIERCDGLPGIEETASVLYALMV